MRTSKENLFLKLEVHYRTICYSITSKSIPTSISNHPITLKQSQARHIAPCMATTREDNNLCNAEEIDKKVNPESIDSIFSVACFEHIYDLPSALEACNTCSKKEAPSFFAPIYSRIDEGDHGVIPCTRIPREAHRTSLTITNIRERN